MHRGYQGSGEGKCEACSGGTEEGIIGTYKDWAGNDQCLTCPDVNMLTVRPKLRRALLLLVPASSHRLLFLSDPILPAPPSQISWIFVSCSLVCLWPEFLHVSIALFDDETPPCTILLGRTPLTLDFRQLCQNDTGCLVRFGPDAPNTFVRNALDLCWCKAGYYRCALICGTYDRTNSLFCTGLRCCTNTSASSFRLTPAAWATTAAGRVFTPKPVGDIQNMAALLDDLLRFRSCF